MFMITNDSGDNDDLKIMTMVKMIMPMGRLAQSVGLSCSVKSGLKIFVLFVFTFRDKL